MVLAVVGTRPEAIKLAPVVLAARLADPHLHVEIVVTGQHGKIAVEALSYFGLEPDHILECDRPTGRLPELLAALVAGLGGLLHRTLPSAVVVQGDTSSALAGALAAFYEQIPVVHLEAGLFTATVDAPFPEEAHRRLVSSITSLHLAPTTGAAFNLLARGVGPVQVVITGNTVVDALLQVCRVDGVLPDAVSTALAGQRLRLIVVTAHRRESWGEPMREIARALVTLADRNPDVLIAVVRHPNPMVAAAMAGHLGGRARIVCLDPVPYPRFATLLARSCLVLTDSGGLQEELPTLGVPAVVLRSETERPEAVLAGWAVLAGTDHDTIVALASDAMRADVPCTSENPFGDGRAAGRAVGAISWMLGRAPRPVDYAPPQLFAAPVSLPLVEREPWLVAPAV